MIEEIEIYICTLVSDWDDDRMHSETFVAHSARQAKEWAQEQKKKCSAKLRKDGSFDDARFDTNEDGSYFCYFEDNGDTVLSYGCEQVTITKNETSMIDNCKARIVELCASRLDEDDVNDAVRDMDKYRCSLRAVSRVGDEIYDLIHEFCDDNGVDEDCLGLDPEDLIFEIYDEIFC